MSMPLDLYVIRHGESEANVIVQAGEQGDNSLYTQDNVTVPDRSWRLTATGRKQADCIGRWLVSQQQLFDRSQQAYMAQGMSEEEAYAKTATETAIPGTSEHQTGLAADIVTPTYQMLDAGFADTPAGQWLSEHAAEYGFVLRYPQDKQEVTGIIYESWHYRFVGKTHAKLMKESGLCLEEYLQQELPEGYTGASEPYDLPKQP